MRRRHESVRSRKGRSTSWVTRLGGCTRRGRSGLPGIPSIKEEHPTHGGKGPCAHCPIDDVARHHEGGGEVESRAARLGKLLPSRKRQPRLPSDRHLHRNAVTPVVTQQAQS